MSISIITPPNLLPLGDKPTRLSVRIDDALLKVLDPSMEPLAPNDSETRAKRKGKKAMNIMARQVSKALFEGAEVPPLEVYWMWPKRVKRSDGGQGSAVVGRYAGIIFDHLVVEEDLDPRVLGLTADKEVDGVVVFRAKELGAETREFMNKTMYDLVQEVANGDSPGVGRAML